MSADEDTQPFVPVFDETATMPLPVVRRRHRGLLPGVGVLLAASAAGVVLASAQPGSAGVPSVPGPTSYATTIVTGGVISVPTDGATVPSTAAHSPEYGPVVASSHSRAAAGWQRPSASSAPSPSASPSVPSPSASTASALPSGSQSSPSPADTPSDEESSP